MHPTRRRGDQGNAAGQGLQNDEAAGFVSGREQHAIGGPIGRSEPRGLERAQSGRAAGRLRARDEKFEAGPPAGLRHEVRTLSVFQAPDVERVPRVRVEPEFAAGCSPVAGNEQLGVDAVGDDRGHRLVVKPAELISG